MKLIKGRKGSLVFLVFILLISFPSFAKKKWHVDPTMSRVQIQDVINQAGECDTIIFTAGTYDFSDTPITGLYDPTGALEIVDKSLTLQGEPGNLIVGRPSEDPTSDNARGVKGIYIRNADCTRDVTIDGLNFQSFLRGICNFIMVDTMNPWSFLPSGRNMVVKNCSFIDIHRNAIDFSLAMGDIDIKDNQINSNRAGITLSWKSDQLPDLEQPEKTKIKIFKNRASCLGWSVWLDKVNDVMVNGNWFMNSEIGIGSAQCKGKIKIMNNSISNCSEGLLLEGYQKISNIVFADNILTGIVIRGIRIYGDLCTGNHFLRNSIAMSPGSQTAIYSAANGNVFENNLISGTSRFACLLRSANMAGGVISYPHNEKFIDNSVAECLPVRCHFFLDYGSYDNVIQGIASENATFTDLGQDNQISGLIPCI